MGHALPMKSIWSFIRRRLREYLFLISTFPVAIFFFTLVNIGFSTVLLPVAILLFLGLLSIMQWVARVEIRRTNAILKTDFPVVDNWFRNPFFSWEGAKERVTSLRSWMAILYILIAFGLSTFGFVLTILGFAGLFALLLAAGVITASSFNRDFDFTFINDESGLRDKVHVNLNFLGDGKDFRLEIMGMDNIDIGSATINGSFASLLVIVISLLVFLLALWISLRIARLIAKFVEGLLSGTLLPQFESAIKRVTKELKVSERDIREAMNKEALQPQLSELSNREREILALMAQGKSNAGIAKALYITEGSVEKHISNILSKLDLKTGDDNHRRVLAVLTYLGINPKDSKP
jgi:DNA-binding CsgD family transcriptional regulator